jgi:transposase
MSPAFIATTQSLPNAQITFDKFHLVKLINEAVDAVRRAEQKSRAELKKSRYLWLKNPRNLSERQRTQLDNLAAANLKTGRAYRIRLAFQELYAQPATHAEPFLKKWYWWATHSRLPPMIEAARMIECHWSGASSAGSTARSPMASWKPSTASCKPPKPRPRLPLYPQEFFDLART